MKILLTGSNGQIGNSIAKILLLNGCIVYCADIEKSEEGENKIPIKMDVTNENSVRSFFEEHSDINCVINNAGIGVFTPTLERTVDEFKSVMNINILGTFLVSKEYIKYKKTNGNIINIASIYGHRSSDFRIYANSGRNNSEIYSASKAAVLSLTKYFAANFSHLGFRANSISPGGIIRNQENDFIRNYSLKCPQNRMGRDNEVAIVTKFLAIDSPEYLNGEDIKVDGGYSAW